MVRDRETGKSKGFCFLKYDDQRSTVLAVDNFNGALLLGRTLRVDHSREYRQPKKKRRRDESESEESEVELDDEGKPRVKGFNVAPKGWLDPPVEETSDEEEEDFGEGIDLDDPMREYLMEKRREEKAVGKKKKHGSKRIKVEGEVRRHKHRHRSSKTGEERHRHRSDRPRIEGERHRDERDSSRRRHQRERDVTPKARNVTPRDGREREDTPETQPRPRDQGGESRARRDQDDRRQGRRSSAGDREQAYVYKDRGYRDQSNSPERT